MLCIVVAQAVGASVLGEHGWTVFVDAISSGTNHRLLKRKTLGVVSASHILLQASIVDRAGHSRCTGDAPLQYVTHERAPPAVQLLDAISNLIFKCHKHTCFS